MKEEILNNLDRLKDEAKSSFGLASSEEELYNSKVLFLGKKGKLTEVLKDIGRLGATERPLIGQRANEVKNELEDLYTNNLKNIKNKFLIQSLQTTAVDVTLPGTSIPQGRLHPISLALQDLKNIFMRLGFDVFEGPEIESDYYNFEALNIPPNHPARDMQDTFYLGDAHLLRTHTSPVQIHTMEANEPPIAMIAPGVVYRRDSDVTHTPMFHQIEGLMVDKKISLGHLKGIIETFLKEFFASQTKVQFRPSFFPFTEPSAEVDIQCVMCRGKGCRVCKGTGWLEVMGCGMVHPRVFEGVNINPETYTGFAFGMGIERLAMLKYGINDIRLFFDNDIRFLGGFTC